MTRYVIRRVGAAFVVLLVFVTGLFFLVNLVVPGDWTSQFILTADQRASFQQQLGLDRTLWQQYWDWMRAVGTFDLGIAFSGIGVWDAIRDALASTLLVLTVGLGIAFGLGSWLGRAATWSRRRIFGGAVTFVAILSLTAFPPAMAFLFERGVINSLGRPALSAMRNLDPARWAASDLSPSGLLWRMDFTLVAAVLLACGAHALAARRGRPLRFSTILLVAGSGSVILWFLVGWGDLVADVMARVALITLAVTILAFGEVVLITRATMEDMVDEDFVMAARAKGLPDRKVRDHHAARAALLPSLSRFVVAIPYLLTGLVILESVFDVGGMGTLIFDALRLQDTPLVAGSLLVVGVIAIVMRILLEIAHVVLDPRLRAEESSR